MIDLNLKLNDDNIKMILEKDFIDRNRYLNGVIKILDRENKSRIIALDGDWGSGKTWFVKSLEYLINKELDFKINKIDLDKLKNVKDNYMTFYYNAWENDDAPSAMLSLIYKLVNDSCLLKEKDSAGPIPRLLNTVIKFISNGSVDIKQDLFGDQWNNKQITDTIKTSEEIKDTFRELIDNLLIESKNKLLIMIDEIDRCRPTFAIELLENIKHFYDDDRIIFIVATNNKQLGHSVCKVYGNNYDGYGYLDKFFDLNLELPNNYIDKYIKAIDENTSSIYFKFKNPREIAKRYDFTMREYNRYKEMIDILDLEKYFDNTGLNYSISGTVKYLIIPIALAYRIKNKSKYYKLIRGENFEEIENLIRKEQNFYDVGKNLAKSNDAQEFVKINSLKDTSDEEKIKLEENKIIEIIKGIYDNIFIKYTKKNIQVEWEYNEKFEEILDIISMMN